MFTGKGALRTKKIMNHAKRKTCTINGKCNDVYPKTVKRFYVTLGRYEDEVEYSLLAVFFENYTY